MTEQGLSPSDPSSFSRPDQAIVRNLQLAFTVNFAKKILQATVTLAVDKIDPAVTEVILDSKDLKIDAIYEVDLGVPLKYKVSDPVGEFGSKLTIELPTKPTSRYNISVRYETSPNASGLQWLTPDQTAGKVHPYLFSQFQAIATRSVIPCQDTPSVKAPYTALITVPLNLTAVMSAVCDDKKVMPGGTGLFHFVQTVPVQSYLIALAVGALESRDLSPRCKVWAEKEIIDAAEYEFANTEKQLQTAEKLCGPYVWGRYDLLVLPPSFPFGGMENPCLTFVTPTLLAGDRSLANVVAHEIAHSWTGNLVTNKNFEHFWLNEGFTVFIERRIISRLEGKEAEDFEALGGLEELKECVTHLGPENNLTALVVNLKNNVHPDDAFSRIPYEKGSLFLRYLETVVGGPEKFEPFLRSYFETFKYKSITTDDFKKFFENHFSKVPKIKSIDWNTWLYSPGMPPIIPEYNKAQVLVCDKMKSKLLEGKPITKNEVENLTSGQKIHFLQSLLDAEPLSREKLDLLKDLFNLENALNAEIKFRWYRLSLKAGDTNIVGPVLKWITEIGRMKYIRPLYRDLYQLEAARPQAIKNYKDTKHLMMHVSAYTVAKDLHLNEI